MDVADLENRFKFHPTNTEEKQNAHTSVRTKCLKLALELNAVIPDGREKSLAITHLEEAMFWSNAGLARTSS